MSDLLRSLRRIPLWAYLLIILVAYVNIIYQVFRYECSVTGETAAPVNGHWIVNFVREGSPMDRAGIKVGDTAVSFHGVPIYDWVSNYHGQKAGDRFQYGILKNNQVVEVTVVTDRKISVAPGFYWSAFIMTLLISFFSLIIPVKKPGDKAAIIFFIYIQLACIAVNSANIIFPEPVFISGNLVYILCSCMMGPALIHFHLLFPRPVRLFRHVAGITWFLYSIGLLVFLYTALSYYFNFNPLYEFRAWVYNLTDRIAFLWITLTFFLALAVVVYQYLTVENTLLRHQMLIVFTGSFFGFLTPILYGLFYYQITDILTERNTLLPISQAVGSFIMIGFLLIAIFRYRIWDMEVVIRKALLYLTATAIIILTYLFLIWLVDRFTTGASDLIRFAALAISVILFLVFRDRLQRLVNRIFHREEYDPATVVSEFEAKLAGIYRSDDLIRRITENIDGIFHFKSFVFSLKKNGLIYAPVSVHGAGKSLPDAAFEITREMEEKLTRTQVFSPEELSGKPAFLSNSRAELIIPMISDGRPGGFFLCGQKRSERIYSRQDIRVLKLLAQRAVSLLHTADLYRKDLDRQLMLERERARISEDMHDDVGASLTRIAMMSDVLKKRSDVGEGAREWLGKISETSRGLMEEMNQIIWALNPKNDNLESLVTYIRRFAIEYLEPTPVKCLFDLPSDLPELALTVEVRRNIYLVVREALHNVVKHSGATLVTIHLSPSTPSPDKPPHPSTPSPEGEGVEGERSFTVSIRDNGKGFDPQKPAFPGNGLVNMQKRIEDIGGEFQIVSDPGEGTAIEIHLTRKGD